MAAAADGAGKFSFSIDRGGTFTDVYAATPTGTRRGGVSACCRSDRLICRPGVLISRHAYVRTRTHAITSFLGYRVLKLLSEDPANYPDAPREVCGAVAGWLAGWLWCSGGV